MWQCPNPRIACSTSEPGPLSSFHFVSSQQCFWPESHHHCLPAGQGKKLELSLPQLLGRAAGPGGSAGPTVASALLYSPLYITIQVVAGTQVSITTSPQHSGVREGWLFQSAFALYSTLLLLFVSLDSSQTTHPSIIFPLLSQLCYIWTQLLHFWGNTGPKHCYSRIIPMRAVTSLPPPRFTLVMSHSQQYFPAQLYL